MTELDFVQMLSRGEEFDNGLIRGVRVENAFNYILDNDLGFEDEGELSSFMDIRDSVNYLIIVENTVVGWSIR